MKNTEKTIKKISKSFAKAALKVGIASSNSACRLGYYQNKVPDAMRKFKNKK